MQGDLDSLETIYRLWSEIDSTSSTPDYYIVSEYTSRKIKLDSAYSIALRALSNALANNDGSRALWRTLPHDVSLFYGLLAQIQFLKGNPIAALSHIQAAKQYAPHRIDPSLLILEGAIWQQLHRNEQAERSYIRAYMRGSNEAHDSLQSLFKREHGGLGGYSTYLTMLSEDVFQRAPDFSAANLQGKQFHLADHRGKVVVITFWYIGCPACIIEERSLKRLVSTQDTGDVVFVSVTRDHADRVKEYFKGSMIPGAGKEFYSVHIPSAQHIIKAFDVTAFPTHIVIDHVGRITSTTTGGSDRIDEVLRKMIDAAKSTQ